MKKQKKTLLLLFCSFVAMTNCARNTKTISQSSSTLVFDSKSCSTEIVTIEKEEEKFLFFTDPHLYAPRGGLELNKKWYEHYLPLFEKTVKEEDTNFVMCGGDLLNNGDTKDQALFKIEYFVNMFHSSISNFYILVGNHDTNYQGDTYIESKDYKSCMLSQDEINLAMYNGQKAYYSFETKLSRYYCFDSGIDWDSDYMNDYRWEQISWFANNLLSNENEHITLFVHIAVFGEKEKTLTALMKQLGFVISAFNKKEQIEINNERYDFSACIGHIDFVQAGHLHEDINNFLCGGIPVIITTSFFSQGSTTPTFDIVNVDYDKHVVLCKRFGEGEDRLFTI